MLNETVIEAFDSLTVQAYYSPSGSFMHIFPEKTNILNCGENVTYRVQYSTSINANIDLYYKVSNRACKQWKYLLFVWEI